MKYRFVFTIVLAMLVGRVCVAQEGTQPSDSERQSQLEKADEHLKKLKES